MKVISLILAFLPQFLCQSSQCICTTVPCPQVGENNIIMGNGGANITYLYEEHNNIPVVIKGEGYVYPSSLGIASHTT